MAFIAATQAEGGLVTMRESPSKLGLSFMIQLSSVSAILSWVIKNYALTCVA